MMITRAPISCSVRRLGLVHRLHACTVLRRGRRSSRRVVSRRPTLLQEEYVLGRGPDTL